jgi:uncharacterized cupin superfamily protein
LIPPHTHSHEDECSYVLEGHRTFDVGGSVVTVGPGSYVVKPRGVFHAFWNATDEPARVMEIHAPGAFEAFYGELAQILSGQIAPEQQGAAIGELNALRPGPPRRAHPRVRHSIWGPPMIRR